MAVDVISRKTVPLVYYNFRSCFSLQNVSAFVRSCVAYFPCF